jgi:hypothetical protein
MSNLAKNQSILLFKRSSSNSLRLKEAFKKSEGKVFLREFDHRKFEFKSQGDSTNIPTLKLGIHKFYDVLGHLDKNDTTRNPYFLQFIYWLILQLNPRVYDPLVWIWITQTTGRHAQVIHYEEGHMKDYTLTSAQYFIHPNEQLYTKEPKGKTKPREVFLAFLLKKDMTHLPV